MPIRGNSKTAIGRKPARKRAKGAGAARMLPGKFDFPADGLDRAARSLGLSPRQAKVAALIFRSKKDKEIAAALRLSQHTVRTYINRIFIRLGVNDRVGLVLRIVASCPPACTNESCPYKQ